MNKKDTDLIYEVVGLTTLYLWGSLSINQTVKQYKEKLQKYQGE